MSNAQNKFTNKMSQTITLLGNAAQALVDIAAELPLDSIVGIAAASLAAEATRAIDSYWDARKGLTSEEVEILAEYKLADFRKMEQRLRGFAVSASGALA